MIRLLLVVVTLAYAAPGAALHAHEHGIARLDVAVDGARLLIGLESPLDNLVGFEHAPRSDKQRAALKKMTEELMASERLYKLPAGAECKSVRVALEHPHQGGGLAAGKAEKPDRARDSHDDAHAELRGTWEFVCGRSDSLIRLDVQLFDVFPGIKRIRAQIATARGQATANLTAAKRTIAF